MMKLALLLLALTGVASAAEIPTLWIIGDSTVRNGQGNGANKQWGWGDLLAPMFDPAKITVANRARGGTSTKTFLPLWANVLPQIKPGDFVLMQFGHNDSSPINDKSRARGTVKGTGDEIEEIDNQLTGVHEIVHSYGWYLRKFIADTRERGATPVVCSPVPRNSWREGRVVRSKDNYAGWAAEIAESAKVPFIDLNELVAAEYDKLGEEKVASFFPADHTHTDRGGAELTAGIVLKALHAILPAGAF